MQKLLIINDYKVGGGAEVIAQQLGSSLGEYFNTEYYYGADSIEDSERTVLGYLYSREHKKRLLNKLLSFSPDIIHVHNYYHLLSPSILKSLSIYRKQQPHVRIYHTAHDFYTLCPNSGLEYYSILKRNSKLYPIKKPNLTDIIFKLWDHRGVLYSSLKTLQWLSIHTNGKRLNVFDKVICPSTFLLNGLKSHFPYLEYVLIRNPCQKMKLKRDERIKDTKVRFIFAGRLEREKGLIPFIENLGNEDIWDTIKLDIYGSGTQEPLLKNLISQDSYQGNISLMGNISRSEISSVMSGYDALVLPSMVYENAPLSIVEAAIAGLRILTVNHGGMKEMAELCGGSYLYGLDNNEELISTMNRLITDVNKNRPIVRDPIVLKELFSEDTFIQAHLSTYVDL